MGVHQLPGTGLIGALAFIIAVFMSEPAAAALPPFDLVRESLVQTRKKQKSTTLDLRVTQTSGKLVEWKLAGKFAFGEVPQKLGGEEVALRLLWIALLSSDPVGELQKRHGLVNASRATVGVQEQFVYVYGGLPAVSVFRDLKRLAALSVESGGHTWVARLTWDDDRLTGAMITRDGRTVLTARSATPPSRQSP